MRRSLVLSEEAQGDVKRLRFIRRSLSRRRQGMEEMVEERRRIWKRRTSAGDLNLSELARLSGVTQPFVKREVSK